MKGQAFAVVYDDDNLIAVNKVSGLCVGGERWDTSGRRLDRILDAYLGKKVYMLHRIDKDTSGLVVFGKNGETHRRIGMAFEGHLVHKTYLAIVHGRPAWPEIDGAPSTVCGLPLVPNGDKRHRTIVNKFHGKLSLTRFRLLGSVGGTQGAISLVECIPETGRTHQIRVHLAALGHPIVCDPLYGKSAFRSVERGVYLSDFKGNWRGDAFDERPLLNRLGLHAWKMSLPPGVWNVIGKNAIPGLESSEAAGELNLCAALHKDMKALIKQMGKTLGQNLIEEAG
jgi:RluA family pseudouridine synthase